LIDIHCHILPGVDDGAHSLKESLVMARMAFRDGIHTIVATPHTLDGIHINPVQEVASRVASLQHVLLQNRIHLRLCVGADVHLCPRILERIRTGEAATINDARKYLLLELPSQTIPSGVKDEIFNLKLNGITPIISHPERNPVIHKDVAILYELVSMGALCQVTAMSITGEFGGMVKECAELLLRHRLVHVIATDAHSSDRRPPVLSDAVEIAAEILGSYEDARHMVTDVPASILSGDVFDVPEPMRIKRGTWC